MTVQCSTQVVEGLGATLDVILVNGCLHAGDTMVLCTQDGPIVTTARALLTPPPSRETRVKSELIKHESLEGAIGLKITGDPELTKVVPGTGILVMHQDDDVEDLKVRRTASSLDFLTPSTRVVSVRRGRGWFFFRIRTVSDGVGTVSGLYVYHAGGVHEGHRQLE